MFLVKSKYKGFATSEVDKWGHYSLRYENLNLLIGKNASGKSHVISNIAFFAKILVLKESLSKGYWEFIFLTHDQKEIKFKCLVAKTILEEELFVDEVVVLHRDKNTATIFSETQQKFVSIEVPADKLLIQTYGDSAEFPHLLAITQWAKQLHNFDFNTIDCSFLETLGEINEALCKKIKDDFNSLGYCINKIGIKANTIYLTENLHELPLSQTSQGMQKAFLLLLFVQYLLDNQTSKTTLLLDDLGLGLDQERAKKLSKIVFDKLENSPIQLISTTHEVNLMEVVNMKYWQILMKDDDKAIRSLNFENSRFRFRELKNQGIQQFDAIFNKDALHSLE